KGILFYEGEPVKVLTRGKHRFLNLLKNYTIEVYSERDPWLKSKNLDIIIKSGIANEFLTIIDLKDNERALVWIENRFARILSPGIYALWNSIKKIKVEIVNAEEPLFYHNKIDDILKCDDAAVQCDVFLVSEGHKGLFFYNGVLAKSLEPGRYVFWKGVGKVKLYHKDLREVVVDISGQDIMTRDNVTLRINAVLSYRIIDPLKVVLFSEDITQSLYREAQLGLRGIIGTRELDAFLSDKTIVESDLVSIISKNAEKIGIEIQNFGIRDIILPGDMKELLNKVTEAKKIAEANLISRREEVAAMRSQVNTAKMLENNPSLMKLRELETLEKVSVHSKLNIILGNEKLTEKVVNLI
ncbi:MAG: slipin family protein, partial [Spirochaetales bacterium]|nr:slipin family protein [Spirochaetales bacterium]